MSGLAGFSAFAFKKYSKAFSYLILAFLILPFFSVLIALSNSL